MTLGEYRVGISFNPSSNVTVDLLKRAAANFIDLVSDLQASSDDSAWEEHADKFRKAIDAVDLSDIPERGRLCAIAHGCLDGIESGGNDMEGVLTLIEDAAMWAVKAATKGPME